MSITLTFSIWTYTPKLDPIDQSPTVEIAIADKMDVEEIVKPYKLLFNFKEDMKGTTDSSEISFLMNTIRNWRISDIELEDTKFTTAKLDDYLREENRFTLFYAGEVPLGIYEKFLNIEESSLEGISFDRIIVNWNVEKSTANMHFISQQNELRYRAKIKAVNPEALIVRSQNYDAYVEANPKRTTRFIAVPEQSLEIARNIFYERETSLSKFRDALFSDRNAVRRSQVGLNHEEFKDDHAIMSVDTTSKRLHYFHPVAESKEPGIPPLLLRKTIDFMNEHGGWTEEFRFTYMNAAARNVKFRLYIHGLPVYSDTTSTEIEQIWGDNRIFRYMRPYYTLDLTLPYETEPEQLISGRDAADLLMKSADIDFQEVQEITPAYFMTHNTSLSTFTLEPSWYYRIHNRWVRLLPTQLGGE